MNLRIVLVALVLLIVPALAETPHRSETAETAPQDPWLSLFAHQVKLYGLDAQLPPMLSLNLGLVSKPESFAVKQGRYIEHQGTDELIKAFNVPADSKSDVIVLFTSVIQGSKSDSMEDKQKHQTETTLYLTSSTGVLVNAVNSRRDSSSPTGYIVKTLSAGTLPKAKTTADFEAEKDYWREKLKLPNRPMPRSR